MKYPLLLFIFFAQIQFSYGQNIGIGTDQPLEKLHVKESIRIDASIPQVNFYQGLTYASSIGQNGNNLLISNKEIGNIGFTINNQPLLFMIPTGQIGINTTSPLDALHLRNGAIRIEDDLSPELKLFQNSIYAASFHQENENTILKNLRKGALSFYTDNINRMAIDSIGRVGIGSTSPLDKLHIKNGDLRIDSNFPALHLYGGSTRYFTVEQNGLNSFIKNIRKGSLIFSTDNISRMAIDNIGNLGIGTIQPLDKLHINNGRLRISAIIPEINLVQGSNIVSSLEQNGNHTILRNRELGNLHFYTNNIFRATIDTSGYFGLGTSSPKERIHIKDGSLRIEDSANAASNFYIGENHTASLENSEILTKLSRIVPGDIHIKAINGTGNIGKVTLSSSSGGYGILLNNTGKVGINNLSPIARLDLIESFDSMAMLVKVITANADNKYGIISEITSTTQSNRIAVQGKVETAGNSQFEAVGFEGIVSGSGNSKMYGVRGVVDATGISPKYALYGEAPLGFNNWAMYAKGKCYMQTELRIGTTSGVSGYALVVNGKTITEEVKVQLNSAWPDYVFNEDYKLSSLSETENFIKQHKHLPGVPSASEVSENNGIELGEMNRILLEKVEELTLHVIRLEKEIKSISDKTKSK